MKRIFLFVFLCFGNFIFAESLKLDLQSAVKLALTNNSDLKRQKIILEAAARKSKNSYNSLMPSITISAGDTYAFPGEESANTINLEGAVSLNLKTNFIVSADKNKINYQIEKTNYEILANTVNQAVRDSYFEIIETMHLLSLKKENIKILKDLYEENTHRYRKGFLNEIEYLNSRILYEKSMSDMTAIQMSLTNLTNSFKLLLGITSADEIIFEGDTNQFFDNYAKKFTEKYQSEILSLIESNELPNLKLLIFQKYALEKELRIKKLENFGPDFNLTYQMSPVIGRAGQNVKIKNTFNVGLSIPLGNLLPASTGREEIHLAKDQITDIDILLSAKKQEASITLENLLLLINQKMTTLATCKSLVEITSGNLNICQVSYSKGLIDFQNLKNANSEYLEAQLEYSSMILDILKTFSSLEQITGKIISEK